MSSPCRNRKQRKKTGEFTQGFWNLYIVLIKDYSPLDNAITKEDKINKLMNTFPKIMEIMNEKKQLFINTYPDKAREVMRRLAFTSNVGVGHLIVQKRPGVHKGK